MVATSRKFEFELVSPERLVLSEPVDMAVVPGADGYFGVLAGHSPLISTLQPGVIDIWQGETIEKRLFVAGGFAEVTAERCTVLADQAIAVSEINVAAVEAEITALADEAREVTGAELHRVEAQLKIARAKLAAVQGSSIH